MSASRKTSGQAYPLSGIKKVRTGMRLSQAAFARLFGFSVSALSAWERGIRRPRKMMRVLLTIISREPEAALRAIQQ